MQSPLEPRRAREDDLGALAALFTRSVHALGATHYDAAQLAAWAPEPPDLASWRERLAPLVTLVVERDARLAGFLAYERRGHVELLYTAPGMERTGVATRLYLAAERELSSLGVRALTTEASLVARPFFERQGFRVVEEQRVERRGQSFVRFAMRKELQAG